MNFGEALFKYASPLWPVWLALIVVPVFGLSIPLYFLERKKQGADFTWGTAMYFTCITLLTVGYGDITPKTRLGRGISVLNGIIGVTAIGVWISVLIDAVKSSG